MGQDETPFARVPEPGAGPRPTPVTYEQQLADVGAIGAGLGRRSPRLQLAVRFVAALAALAIVLAIAWGLLAG
jgi:hypothetical protein